MIANESELASDHWRLTLAAARFNNNIITELKTSRVGDYMGFPENNKILRSAESATLRRIVESKVQLVAPSNVIDQLVNSLVNDY